LHLTEACCRGGVFHFASGQCLLIAALVLNSFTYLTKPFDQWAAGRVLPVEEKMTPSGLYQTN